MTHEEKLSRFLGLNYEIRVRKVGDTHIFFIRELGLRHASKDLAAGHAEILEKKDAWIRDLAEEGLWDWIVEPGGQPDAASLQQAAPAASYKPFFIKFALVCMLGFALVTVVSNGLREAGFNLERKIDNLVLMPPQDMEKYRAKTHTLATRLRPIMLELVSMFHPEPEGAAQDNASAAAAPAQTTLPPAAPAPAKP